MPRDERGFRAIARKTALDQFALRILPSDAQPNIDHSLDRANPNISDAASLELHQQLVSHATLANNIRASMRSHQYRRSTLITTP
jgi:hypothetical protein